MKLHLPSLLRSSVLACFAAAGMPSTTLSAVSPVCGLFLLSFPSYGSYNAETATFEGTNNNSINLVGNTYAGVDLLIFNMGSAGTANYFNNDSWTYAGDIQIGAAGATSTGLCINNGYSDKVNIFTGRVTGSGMLSKTGAGNRLQIAFEGDVTEFTGAIKLGSTALFSLRFGGGGDAAADADHGVSGTGDISFIGTDKDTLIYHYAAGCPVYITNRITTSASATSKAELRGGADYVLTKDVNLSHLTLTDNTSLHIGVAEKRSETVLGALTMGAGATVHVDNGTFEVTGATALEGGYEVGTQGVLRLSRPTTVRGTLSVHEGGALAIGSISGYNISSGMVTLPAEGENGFAFMDGALTLLTGDAALLQSLEGTRVLFENQELALGADGAVAIATTDFSAYYLRRGEVRLSSLMEESGNRLQRVDMEPGATLTVDTGDVAGSISCAEEKSLSVSCFLPSAEGLPQRITLPTKTTMRIVSTVENNAADINLSADSHLIFDADSPTTMSVGSIINTAGSSNDFNRSIYIGSAVTMRAASVINSWGIKSLTVDGVLDISGDLSFSTGSTQGGNTIDTNILAGQGRITAGSLTISHKSRYNTLSVNELVVRGNASLTRPVTISSGTTEVQGNTTVTGALELTGGHLILGDALSDTAALNADIHLAAGALTLNGTATASGTLTQTGGTLTINGQLTMGGTATASGSVYLNGTLNADIASLSQGDEVSYSEGENGFRNDSYLLFAKGEKELNFFCRQGASVLVNGEDITADVRTDASGNIVFSVPNRDIYYLNTGSQSLSAIRNAADATLQQISLEPGTVLVMDIGAIQGQMSVEESRLFTLSSGEIPSTFTGHAHLEQLSATQKLTVGNGATLSIGSTAEAGTQSIDILANGRLVFESDAPAERHLAAITASETGATLRVKNADLLHGNAGLTFTGGTTLEVEGVNTISAASVEMQAGSTLSFVLGGTPTETALLTINGKLTTDSLNLALTFADDLSLKSNNIALVRLNSSDDYDVSGWTPDKVHVTGAAFENLTWEGGCLSLRMPSLSWENSQQDAASVTLRVYGAAAIAGEETLSAWLNNTKDFTVHGMTADAALSVSPALQVKSLTVENAAMHLGNHRHNIGSLNISHAVVTSGSCNSSDGFIRGTVNIGVGGTLSLEEYDALGWGGGATPLIRLQGEAEAEAVLELGARQTFSTNIEMNGHSRLAVSEHPTGSGGNRPGLDTYGGAITASGKDNRIEVALLQRDNLRMNVEEGGELQIVGAVVESSSGRYGSLIKEGSGTLLINTPSDTTIMSFKQQGGKTVLGGETITLRDYTQTQGCLQVNGHATFRGTNSLQGGRLEVGENHTLTLYDNTTAAPGTLCLNGGTVELAGTLTTEGTLTATGTLTFSPGGRLLFSSSSLESYGEYTLSEGVNGFAQTSYYLIKKGEGNLLLEGVSDDSFLLDGSSLAGLAVKNADGDLVAENVRTGVYYAHEGEVRYTPEMQEAGLCSLVLTYADLVLTQNLSEGVTLCLLNEGERHHVILEQGVTLDAASLCGEGSLLLSGTGTFCVADTTYLPTTAQYADWSGLTSVSVGITATEDIDMVGIGRLRFDTAGRSSAVAAYKHNVQMCDNDDITFTSNAAWYGGAINHINAHMDVSRNNHVCFSGNRASYGGGALYNYNMAELSFSGNKSLTFTDNTVGDSYGGGAIYNYYASTLVFADNDQVVFRDNSANYGGAIENAYHSSLQIIGNKDVLFSGNSAITYGGAIYLRVSYIDVIDNGNVLFEKNAERENGTVRLRSLYTTGSGVSLSAAAGGHITFRDSVYFSSSVLLNSECIEDSACSGNHGSIILTGATTEADLSEVKGGIAGTEDEVNRSRFSQMLANVSLGSGALEVRDKAVLKTLGLTIGSESHTATLRLHDAWLDSSDHIVMETGSGWEISGKNHLVSSGVVVSGQNTITLRLTGATDEGPLLTVTGDLKQGELLTINVEAADSLRGENILLIHHSVATEGWESARLQLNGEDSDALVWSGGDLYLNYNASHDIPPVRTVTALSGQELVVDSSMVWETGGKLSFDLMATVINDNAYFVVTDYEDVSFSVGPIGPTVEETLRADGGAVCNFNDASATLSGNRMLCFSGNQVSGRGGAIYSAATMALTDNESVLFDGNQAQLFGGAINNVGTLHTFLINGNDDVTFRHNSVVDTSGVESPSIYGGAINNNGYLTIHGNERISFIENSVIAGNGNSTDAAYAHGGAFASMPDTCLSGSGGVGHCIGNTTIEFLRNTAEVTAYSAAVAYGGAAFVYVYFYPFEMKDNTSVSFCENAVHSTTTGADGKAYAGGGALYHTGDEEFEMFGNRSLSFCGNTVEAEGTALARSFGGAIENEILFSLCDNGDVTFSGNRVTSLSATKAVARGGAIYNWYRLFEIGGNGDVLFEKNAEVENGVYRLRSVYSESGMNLSASAGKSMTFRDSLFIGGDVSMNRYVAEGQEAPTAYGSIVLTGATTEADLREVKGGTVGTASEIHNSRTSEIQGTLTLGGGRLVIADGAELRTGDLEVLGGATVEIADGRLTVSDEASSTLSNCTLVFTKGGKVDFGRTLTLNGSVSLEVSGFETGSYTLFSANAVQGAECLYLNVSAADAGRYSLAWNELGDTVELVVADVPSPQEKPTIHVWNGGNSSLSHETSLGGDTFKEGDVLVIRGASNVLLSGTLLPSSLEVDTEGQVKLTNNKKTAGSGIGGEASVTKSGAGVLTLNAGNSYSGGTELNAGTIKATAADSFGSGVITVKGGTLDLASKAVTNDIILSGAATLKGDAKYAGNVTVEGKATLMAKTSYKGTTTIGEDSSLTLGAAATMAGNVALEGGTLTINNAKGMTLAKNQSMMLDGGEVRGLVTVGAGGTLAWQEGTMQNAPVLKGGTLDLGGKNALTLTGVKAQVQFGDKVIDLPGKGIVRSDETLDVLSGTVKLTMGKETTDAAITVSGNAALVNGATHSGDITVNGTLAKGTTIKLIGSHQTVNMNGAGTTAAAISGIGTVNVNLNAGERIDATAAKLTAANINLNGGTFTNTKGIKLVKGQTLTLNGANVNLGAKGILTTAASSTLKVSESATLSGSLTLGGGDLVFEGSALTVKGTLTLSKPVSVTGSGTLICDSVKPFKGDLGTLFGGADVKLDGTTLTINGGATKKSLVAAPVAEEKAPLVATPALPTLPAMPATNPVADAIAQADWSILDANRAFTGAVATRHQHAALLDKGRGAAWVSAFGTSVRHGNQGAHHGSDGNIEGAALGMEHSVSETGVLGLAVGRSKNRIGATGVTHLRQETAHVALYGQKQFKHNLTADATAAWGDTETKLGGSAWQQKSAALSGRLTHAHMVNDATAVRTFGGLSYEATESGSFGAANRSGSVQNLRAELGAGASHAAGKAHVYGEASLTGDLIRHNPSVELGGIRHHGATPGRVGVKASLGAFYELTDTWTGTASYSLETESRTTSHTLNLGVSKSF